MRRPFFPAQLHPKHFGFWIALIPPAILALLEFGWQWALIVVVGHVLINSAVDNGLKRRFYDRG